MAIKKQSIEVTQTVVLEYDPESPEFQEALSSYNELISDGDVNEMLRHVAAQLRNFPDHLDFIEGVGYVPLGGAGKLETPDGWSGIRVVPGYDDLTIDLD